MRLATCLLMAQTVSQKDSLTHNLTDSLTNRQLHAQLHREEALHTTSRSVCEVGYAWPSFCEVVRETVCL